MNNDQWDSAPRARDAAGVRAGVLPCLDSDNSNVVSGQLNSSQAKVAYALRKNVEMLAQQNGLGHLGFLTLTFADKINDIREAQRRLNSLCTGVIRHRYKEWITVVERQRSGRVHFHLLVVCKEDIKAGINFDEISRGIYISANVHLRKEWAFWRKTAPAYGFGRTELMPVKANAEAIANYLGKYIAKHIGQRLDIDKGARLVRYSKGTNRVTSRLTFCSIGSYLWRKKMSLLAACIGVPKSDGATCYDAKSPTSSMKKFFGPRWAYRLQPLINTVRLPLYPTGSHYNQDNPHTWPMPEEATEVRNNTDCLGVLEAIATCLVREGERLWERASGGSWLNLYRNLGLFPLKS